MPRGDAHVRIAVETPVNLSADARTLFETLEGALGDDALPRRRAFREAARTARASDTAPEAGSAAEKGDS
jgi:DnaJ-class molecular chaperone